MKRLRECIEEVTKFSLQSHINKSLNFELQLSPEFCSNLLLDSDPIDSNPDISKGVPSCPLYKHLALALNQSIVSGFICSRQGNSALMRDEISSEQKEKWNKLVSTKGLELINIMNTIDFELHVQEPFFSMSRGSMILLNKCLVLEVQDVRHYATFSKMLEAESISQVLPGVNSTEEGLQTYRKFYTEEEERSNGVIAICVSNLVVQPAISLASILSVKGSTLTHGARALAKHVNRSSNKCWGNLNGSDSNKNKLAMGVIVDLIINSCWLNMYTFQPHGDVFEIRVAEGYGARWSKDGYKVNIYPQKHSYDIYGTFVYM
ncbi:Lysine-specific demethylase 5C [Gossypium arboreum]|uniref:Lysine-specific demethylase 5C n=1 Tax=Gossypium arboreum TaxID=29729 RepID=A0A0B0PSK8_GOSAR|nr:Lysine-specific demethylase 5C [Gossypium arboreum]